MLALILVLVSLTASRDPIHREPMTSAFAWLSERVADASCYVLGQTCALAIVGIFRY